MTGEERDGADKLSGIDSSSSKGPREWTESFWCLNGLTHEVVVITLNLLMKLESCEELSQLALIDKVRVHDRAVGKTGWRERRALRTGRSHHVVRAVPGLQAQKFWKVKAKPSVEVKTRRRNDPVRRKELGAGTSRLLFPLLPFYLPR